MSKGFKAEPELELLHKVRCGEQQPLSHILPLLECAASEENQASESIPIALPIAGTTMNPQRIAISSWEVTQ